MTDSCIYLDTYVLQQDMRVRMPKAILSNMGVEKGKTTFDIYLNAQENELIFRVHHDMDVGFENAGIKVVFANELVADAAETYRANHPDCIMVNDDINNVIDSLGKYEGVDLVFGGPPCQGFSVAGKMDPDDDRSKLIFTFLDVVERVKPRAFVMENVKVPGCR